MAFWGVLLFFAVLPFTYVGATAEFGPQPSDDVYLYYGDDLTPKNTSNGITLSVDALSISYQSVKATITLDNNLIQDRNIDSFKILANGIEVDFFRPSFEGNVWHEFYYVDMNITDRYIGSDVNFQVVAVTVHPDASKWVSAWSQLSPVYTFKALPVTDSDTHGLLQAILDKLDQLKADLSGKLDAVKAAVEQIYVIKPETQAKFDAALQELQDALPTETLKNDMTNAESMINNSADRINTMDQPLTFGEIPWMSQYTTITTPLLDFTDFTDQIAKLRLIMQITLWCEFFLGIFLLLRPKLTI